MEKFLDGVLNFTGTIALTICTVTVILHKTNYLSHKIDLFDQNIYISKLLCTNRNIILD